MVTDDERREVAARLRSVAREVDRGGFSETIKHVKLAVFEDADRYRPNGTLDRLADLIEPRCDRDALLALADEIYDTSCDNHGELTVDLIDIWGWSQAICEALEVQDA